eukprot:UN22194
MKQGGIQEEEPSFKKLVHNGYEMNIPGIKHGETQIFRRLVVRLNPYGIKISTEDSFLPKTHEIVERFCSMVTDNPRERQCHFCDTSLTTDPGHNTQKCVSQSFETLKTKFGLTCKKRALSVLEARRYRNQCKSIFRVPIPELNTLSECYAICLKHLTAKPELEAKAKDMLSKRAEKWREKQLKRKRDATDLSKDEKEAEKNQAKKQKLDPDLPELSPTKITNDNKKDTDDEKKSPNTENNEKTSMEEELEGDESSAKIKFDEKQKESTETEELDTGTPTDVAKEDKKQADEVPTTEKQTLMIK